MKRARLRGVDQGADTVHARLVLLERAPYTSEWERHDPIRLYDDADETGEAKADAHGQRWVDQERENRDYSVLRRKPTPERPRRIE